MSVPADKVRTLALDVHILGRPYKVACKENERASLLDAVTLLDERMQAIHHSNKSLGIERVAVIAALNLANELLQTRAERDDARSEAGAVSDDVAHGAAHMQRRLRELHLSIDQLLTDPEKPL